MVRNVLYLEQIGSRNVLYSKSLQDELQNMICVLIMFDVDSNVAKIAVKLLKAVPRDHVTIFPDTLLPTRSCRVPFGRSSLR